MYAQVHIGMHKLFILYLPTPSRVKLDLIEKVTQFNSSEVHT